MKYIKYIGIAIAVGFASYGALAAGNFFFSAEEEIPQPYEVYAQDKTNLEKENTDLRSEVIGLQNQIKKKEKKIKENSIEWNLKNCLEQIEKKKSGVKFEQSVIEGCVANPTPADSGKQSE